MAEYLITNTRTLTQSWIAAPSVRVALVAHENQSRRVKLPGNSKASVYSEGAMIDASLGESSCIGRRENVIRHDGRSASYA